jgi:ATP-dependent DNA helicase 2 subunit 1
VHGECCHTIIVAVFLTSFHQIAPDENGVKGSSSLFAAMARHMVQRGLIGIAAFCRTKSSMPRLVALLPHLEPAEEEGAEDEVFGMNIVTIPFSNEVRPVEVMDLGGVGGEPVTEEEEEAAEDIVRRMQFAEGFQYQDLQSPAIQHMYAVLQAVALNQVRHTYNCKERSETWLVDVCVFV